MRVWAIPLIAVALLGFYLDLIGVRSGESAHFDITPLTIVFASGAALAIAAGVVAAWASHQLKLSAIFAAASALLVFAVLAMFSVGLLVLPVGLVVLVVAIRRLRRAPAPSARRAAAAGLVVGVGAIAYLLVLIQPAAAVCQAGGGGSTSSGGLFGPTALSQGGYSAAGGEQGGYIDEGDRIAYFTCQGATMTDFHRALLPAGGWSVTTQPSATVGRKLMIVLRARPGGDASLPVDGFDFTATCVTCPPPGATISGHATRAQSAHVDSSIGTVVFVAQVVFPAAGSWITHPSDGPIEVR